MGFVNAIIQKKGYHSGDDEPGFIAFFIPIFFILSAIAAIGLLFYYGGRWVSNLLNWNLFVSILIEVFVLTLVICFLLRSRKQ